MKWKRGWSEGWETGGGGGREEAPLEVATASVAGGHACFVPRVVNGGPSQVPSHRRRPVFFVYLVQIAEGGRGGGSSKTVPVFTELSISIEKKRYLGKALTAG